MSVEDAYMAGIIEGEGSITLSNIRTTSKYRTLMLSVSSTDRELLEWISDTYSGCISSKRETRPNCTSSWHWQVRGPVASRILSRCLPYFKIKRKIHRASVGIEYANSTTGNGRYTTEHAQRCARLVSKFYEDG